MNGVTFIRSGYFGQLVLMCQERGIPFIPFSDFATDVKYSLFIVNFVPNDFLLPTKLKSTFFLSILFKVELIT